MAKYDDTFKKQVVEAYNKGDGGYTTIARDFGIPSSSTVSKLRIVNNRGFDALHRRRSKQNYSSQFKQNVIHYYLNSGDSYLNVALEYGLPSGDLLQHWHQDFLREGMAGLTPKPKGRPSMSKKRKLIPSQKSLTREQELEHENELLRAELAFIKKLRALGMNIPDQLKNDMPESSTNSEESSD